jgi:TorA maturation chaperone TorD
MNNTSKRRSLYAFFANVFSYPEEDLLSYLKEVTEYPSVAGLGEDQRPPATKELEPLQVDYTGLFISRLGGVAAQLYGSVYIDGTLAGESTLQVAVQYAAEGLEVGDSLEVVDFLPTEMEFMHHLVDLQHDAAEASDDEKAAQSQRRQREFFTNFLLPWVPTLCEKLAAEKDAHPLYKWAGVQLASFIESEELMYTAEEA